MYSSFYHCFWIFQPTDVSSGCLSRRRSKDAPLSFREIYADNNYYFRRDIHFDNDNLIERNEISYLWNRGINYTFITDISMCNRNTSINKMIRKCLIRQLNKKIVEIVHRNMTQRLFVELNVHECRMSMSMSEKFIFNFNISSYLVSLAKKNPNSSNIIQYMLKIHNYMRSWI